MKLSEMTPRQQRATINIKYACLALIGELENTLDDYSPKSEEYQDAKKHLADHEWLKNTAYHYATTGYYRDGLMCFNKQTVDRLVIEMNFCGKEFLMERIEKRLAKLGY